MKTISALEKDILLQIPFLQTFRPQKTLSEPNQLNSIFCGTGDSYAAAMLAEAFSESSAKAMDPLDLIKNKSLAKNKSLYLISISGNTISNIHAAKISRKSTAITANTKSRLAKKCSRIINLDYPSTGIFTSGSIGFLASVLTCLSLVTKLKIKNHTSIFSDAILQSKKIKLKNKVYFIGNYQTYPVAMYAAAKAYEVLGIDAHYERIEQFSHMGLFSVKRNDLVIIFEKKNTHNTQLEKNLKKIGLQVIRPEPKSKNKIDSMIFFIFVSQLVPLFCAKKKMQKECHFVNAKKIRNASSSMIY